MSGSPLRLGIVGCGRLAEAGYLPALAGLDAFEVVAVADPDPARRAAVAAASTTGPVAHASIEDLLDRTPVDGLLIASPVASHVADATLAAAAGVVALVEKPPAPDAAGAAVLLGLAPAPHLGFNRRFDTGAIAARAGVAPGAEVDLHLAIRYRRAGWGAHRVADDALLDLGPHLVDWARWISGREVVAVTAGELSHERATLDLELVGGRAHLEAATDAPHEESIRLLIDGEVVADRRVGGARAGLLARVPIVGGSPNRLVSTLRGELVTYAHALRSGDGGQLGTPADGVAAMAVLDAARASAAAGRRRTAVAPLVEATP